MKESNKKIYQEIDGIVDNYATDFLDAYQCINWGISAKKFANLLIDKFAKEIKQIAKELDNGEEEE